MTSISGTVRKRTDWENTVPSRLRNCSVWCCYGNSIEDGKCLSDNVCKPQCSFKPEELMNPVCRCWAFLPSDIHPFLSSVRTASKENKTEQGGGKQTKNQNWKTCAWATRFSFASSVRIGTTNNAMASQTWSILQPVLNVCTDTLNEKFQTCPKEEKRLSSFQQCQSSGCFHTLQTKLRNVVLWPNKTHVENWSGR